jgi:hypothetical protein
MPLQSIISSFRGHTRARRNASLQPNTEKLGSRLADVFAKTWDLGFTAFGGPPVHFQILHRRFVEGLGFFGSKWIDEQTVGRIELMLENSILTRVCSIKSYSQYVKLYLGPDRLRWCSASQ